jgi:PhnB protein
MATVNPYLNFLGNTEEAFNFYRSVFGGEFVGLQRFKDTPEADKLSAADQDKIMHVALPIGSSTILMGTDALESMGHTLTLGNNLSLAIGAESKEEAEKIFHGLAEGGEVEMPLQDTFWGAYFGMTADKFGIKWMVNFDYPQN